MRSDVFALLARSRREACCGGAHLSAFRPAVTLHQDFSVSRHSWFRKAEAVLELKLESDDLFDAVITKVGVLGSERGLGIDARDIRVDRLFWVRVQIDV